MMALLRPALAMIAAFSLLLGLALPLVMTGVAQLAFPFQANGSLLERDGTVVGSALLGQAFTAGRYFHGRPSATTEADPDNAGRTRSAPYNGAASAASQQGPSSAALRDAIAERLGAGPAPVLGAASPVPVPADAVTASGSGLDPHISPENALRQVARVAAARGMAAARIDALVQAQVEGREFGLLGEPRVNVLKLNLALDAIR
jgi:K+-transporting ATPase ATPase C chain